jgi:hypothetical protein
VYIDFNRDGETATPLDKVGSYEEARKKFDVA